MINMPSILPIDWQNIIAGNAAQAPVVDGLMARSPLIDYQSLGPIYTSEDLAKNRHQLDMTDILNAILQMAYNKVYILL